MPNAPINVSLFESVASAMTLRWSRWFKAIGSAIIGTQEKTGFMAGAEGALYIGGQNTDGSWRFVRDGTDLQVQRREAGTWVEKDTHLA